MNAIKHLLHAQPIVNLILTSAILAAIIPISFLGYKLYDAAWDNAWREISEKHQLLAQNIAPSVNMYVETHKQFLESLSYEFSEKTSEDLPLHLGSLLNSALGALKGFHSISWVSGEGALIVRKFKEIYQPKYQVNLIKNSMFLSALEGKWSISNTLISPISGKPTLLMAQPVKDHSGKVTSVLIAELDIGMLEELRANVKFGIGGHAAFVDQTGRALAHPNPEWTAEAKDLSHIYVVKEMMAGKTGVTEFFSPFVNENMVVGYTAIPGLGWGIMVPQPKSEVETQVNAILYSQLQWALIGFIIALMAAYILSRLISSPINKLASGTKQLTSSRFIGELPNLPDYTPREIQDLAHALSTLNHGFQDSQHEIKLLNSSLQQKVSIATEELVTTNRKLEVSVHEAQMASRAKSSFLANMSHELRTPMNAILGYSEILEEDVKEGFTGNLIPDIQKIQHAGKHLLALISDILDLSKIEAGKMEVFIETLDLQDLIEDVAVTIDPLAEKNNNLFEVEYDKSLGEIHTDITKMKQILFNLLSNAFKFTHDGKVSLNVSRIKISDKEMFKFEVTDTGIGMTPEQMNVLFTEFSQADTSTTKKYGGTGLGLTISRFFCHLMNGDINVISTPGEGSKFVVTIPTNISLEIPTSFDSDHFPEEELPDATQYRFDAEDQIKWKGKERRKKVTSVLIIDNDPNAREIIERILRKKGFDTKSAAEGPQGLAIAKALKPNIITMDLNLPRDEGWKILAEIKDDAGLEKVPILVITMLDEKNTAKNSGASAFLTKPINSAQLEKVVQKLARKIAK